MHSTVGLNSPQGYVLFVKKHHVSDGPPLTALLASCEKVRVTKKSHFAETSYKYESTGYVVCTLAETPKAISSNPLFAV